METTAKQGIALLKALRSEIWQSVVRSKFLDVYLPPSEYTSRELQQFCSEKGIIMQYTVAYNPEMNGVAEHMNRTLVDKSKAILADSCLGKEFLGDAVLYSTYVTNRSQAVGKTKTPYELWMGCKPNISNMRAFGSIAYNHVPKQLRTKLDNC